MGPLTDRDKMYAIAWETEKRYPLWRLSANHCICVDVTREFDSKFRLIAYRYMSEELADKVRQLASEGSITTCGTVPNDQMKRAAYGREVHWLRLGNVYGERDDVFKHVTEPGTGWHVTNSAHLMPGIKDDRQFRKQLGVNPHDEGFQIQFFAVPYAIFKRYWRKPVRLTSKWHQLHKTKWSKYRFASSAPCFEVLEFNVRMLQDHKLFWADFSNMHNINARSGDNKDITAWVVKHTPQMKILTDEASPFVKDDHEFLFTMEWL